eukprot:TRINITY_DN3429_c1_g1_i1.p1 TRINITY_DN3429_c1_g1~~TRINITY_DN3429_c1_g1_i1.p1  ORF type:complete len:286 (+),score=23.92 TRINITY_DN3429_c1_g1_i1:39-860(+)
MDAVCCQSVCRRLCGLVERALDGLVITYVSTLFGGVGSPSDDLQRGVLRRLRLPMAIMTILALYVVLLQLWGGISGLLLLLTSSKEVDPSCGPLHRWLLWYCIGFYLQPVCFTFPFVQVWAASGFFWLGSATEQCQREMPGICAFMETMQYASSLGLISCFVIFLIAWNIRGHCRRLAGLMGAPGPTSHSVLQFVLVGEASERPTGVECIICLDEGDVGEGWRSLPCSHSFHENCLVRWLRLQHLCPVCRFNLNEHYFNRVNSLDTQQPRDQA